MKISCGEKLQAKKAGQVKITPEEQEDLWVLSNLISVGDTVSAETSRKVQTCNAGKSNQVRIGCFVDVKITGVDYDNDSPVLRARGKIASNSNAQVNIGSFHTIELEKGKEFVLKKKSWENGFIESLNACCGKKKVDTVSGEKAAKVLKELRETFVFRPDKGCYGSKSVDLASEMGAIETLLIMDHVLRNKSNALRKKYADLVASVKDAGGKTVELSTQHVAADDVVQLSETGVAAILRFPIPDFDD